jgi:hypothetical protein
MAGPIEGLRVVDCSRGTAGPRATGILADYGADVVWVEPPGGDPCRAEVPASVAVFNRGKRSIELDVTDPKTRAQVLALVDRAEVFVESWRPGTAARFGLDYATLHERNPALVYVSISGFGEADGDDALPDTNRSSKRCWAAWPNRSDTETRRSSWASPSRPPGWRRSRSSARSPRCVGRGRTVTAGTSRRRCSTARSRTTRCCGAKPTSRSRR